MIDRTQSFLPVIILFYELLPGRKSRQEANEPDDFPKTLFEDFLDWLRSFKHSKPILVISTLAFTYGAHLVSKRNLRSTFFCSGIDSGSLIVALQWLGLSLDATIAILLWRILAWARTTRSRLKTLSGIFVSSSLIMGFLSLTLGLFGPSKTTAHHYKAPDSLYVFDIFADGFIFSIFCISSGFIICEQGPATFVATLVFMSGLLATTQRTLLIGTWENIWRLETNLALSLLCLGFVFFAYTIGLRSVAFVGRVFLVGFLLILVIASAIFSLVKKPSLDSHPLERLIYDRRVEADRWLVHAAVSKTLKVAVQEYKERNHGRDPPPKFDTWYRFAAERNSPIIDHFAQISSDTLPFWAFPPEEIRQALTLVASQPDIALVKVQNGVASHKQPEDSPHHSVLDNLVGMISTFGRHLPNMEIAVNLNERPRVLAPWIGTHRLGKSGKHHGLRKLISRGSEAPLSVEDTQPGASPRGELPHPDYMGSTSVRTFRQMTALTCPPGSRARSGVHWNIRDFCSVCAKPQSQGQFLKGWDAAQDLCHQPDIYRLHAFHASPPDLMPLQHLLPVFSRSKTSSYSDILIPLTRPNDTIVADDAGADFTMKSDRLYWRGSVGARGLSNELLHGGHQERLVHLINNSSASDKVMLLLSTKENKDRFAYESVPASEVNKALPIDVGIQDYGACSSSTEATCEAAQRELGLKPEARPLGNRYVLLTDSDDGPPAGLVPALRSTSVPFVTSVFREWHAERVMPWVHFVPVDLRYHALHSTLAYFTGLKGRGAVNGRDPEMDARIEDARWIADQGRRWAAKSLRREDMEVYLFRLLLEWGRLIDDDRDKIRFQLG